jgi:hypothetical protein
MLLSDGQYTIANMMFNVLRIRSVGFGIYLHAVYETLFVQHRYEIWRRCTDLMLRVTDKCNIGTINIQEC